MKSENDKHDEIVEFIIAFFLNIKLSIPLKDQLRNFIAQFWLHVLYSAFSHG